MNSGKSKPANNTVGYMNQFHAAQKEPNNNVISRLNDKNRQAARLKSPSNVVAHRNQMNALSEDSIVKTSPLAKQGNNVIARLNQENRAEQVKNSPSNVISHLNAQNRAAQGPKNNTIAELNKANRAEIAVGSSVQDVTGVPAQKAPEASV